MSRHGPLLWADEFDGPAGAPADPSTWQPETGGHGWGNAELQYYTGEPANAALDGAGHLAITVRRADPGLAAARYDGCRYTSARLITRDLKPVRYGLIEASIKIPEAGASGPRSGCSAPTSATSAGRPAARST